MTSPSAQRETHETLDLAELAERDCAQQNHEQRDPLDLRPHPLIGAIPRWGKDTEEWAAFVRDIQERGIQHPILVLRDGTVIDGWTRVLAARALKLETVPCQEVPPEDAVEIMLRELLLRRNLPKSQLAYAAYPLLEPAHQEAAARRMVTIKENLRKGLVTPISYSVADREQKGGVEGIAQRLGICLATFKQAAQLHKIFGEHPELREQFEPSIYDAEKPAGREARTARPACR